MAQTKFEDLEEILMQLNHIPPSLASSNPNLYSSHNLPRKGTADDYSSTTIEEISSTKNLEETTAQVQANQKRKYKTPLWKRTVAGITAAAYIGLGALGITAATPKKTYGQDLKDQQLIAMSAKPAHAYIPHGTSTPTYNTFEQQLEKEVASYEGQNPRMLFRQGIILKNQKKFEEAIPKLVYAGQKTNSSTPFTAAAECAENLQRYTLSLYLADKALKIDNNDYGAMTRKAEAFFALNRIDEAKIWMERGYQSLQNAEVPISEGYIKLYNTIMNNS